MPFAPCASSLRTNAQSSALTANGVWCLQYHPTFALVMIASGYSYFGRVLVLCAAFASSAACIASMRSGALRMKASPMLVMKQVSTFAPFS